MKDRQNANRDQQEGGPHTNAQLTPALGSSTPNTYEPHGYDVEPKANSQPQRREYGFLSADWTMVILNAVLVVVGIATAIIFYRQFREMGRQTVILASQLKSAHEDSINSDKRAIEQLKALQSQAAAAQDSVSAIRRQMRQDQRAWLRVTHDRIPHVLAGEAPIVPLHVTNIGKTTARKIEAFAVMEIINNREQPRFLYPRYNIITFGMKDRDDAFIIQAQLFSANGPLRQAPQPIPADSFRELIAGRAFIVVYALVRYRDIFDVKHWVKFCAWEAYAAGDFSAKACSDYNGVDNN